MNEFTKDTIISIFTDDLEDAKGTTFDDYRNDQFNSDEYIIGRYQANEALSKYDGRNYTGVLGALEDIYDYLVHEIMIYNNLNEIFDTDEDMFEPETVASKLAYCLSDYYLGVILDEAGLDLDDEIGDETIAKFKDAAERVNENNDIEFFQKLTKKSAQMTDFIFLQYLPALPANNCQQNPPLKVAGLSW